MPRYKDEPPAVRVYTVCDESRYLIVRNVPALGCGDELLKLFATYGDIEDSKPMDAEDCKPYTDVYWVKFRLVSNARFAKRKLDEFVFLGNRLQVSYGPQFESVSDTKEKFETRRKEVLARVNSSASTKQIGPSKSSSNASQETILGSEWNSSQPEFIHHLRNNPLQRVTTQQDYFASPSMNQTVCLVREKLNKGLPSDRPLGVDPLQIVLYSRFRTEVDFFIGSASSSEVREALNNNGLRELIKKIDLSANARSELNKAMENG